MSNINTHIFNLYDEAEEEEESPTMVPVVLDVVTKNNVAWNRINEQFQKKDCDICKEILSGDDHFELIRPILNIEHTYRCRISDKEIFSAMVAEHKKCIEEISDKLHIQCYEWTVEKLKRHFGTYRPWKACIVFESRIQHFYLKRARAMLEDFFTSGNAVLENRIYKTRVYKHVEVKRLNEIIQYHKRLGDMARYQELKNGTSSLSSYVAGASENNSSAQSITRTLRKTNKISVDTHEHDVDTNTTLQMYNRMKNK